MFAAFDIAVDDLALLMKDPDQVFVSIYILGSFGVFMEIDETDKSRQCRITANYTLRSTLLKNSESFFKTITLCEPNCLTSNKLRNLLSPQAATNAPALDPVRQRAGAE